MYDCCLLLTHCVYVWVSVLLAVLNSCWPFNENEVKFYCHQIDHVNINNNEQQTNQPTNKQHRIE